MRAPRRLAAALAVAAVALIACGSGGGSSSSGGGSPTAQGKGTITVASANFPENVIIANMYADVLRKAGYDVKTKLNLGNRELYLRALGSGEVDLVPDYLGTLTTFLAGQQDPKAPSPASGDLATTFQALKPLLERRKLVAYQYSPAADQNAFAVTRATADRYRLATLSDLGKPDVAGQLVLGGPPECPQRPFCKPGLEKTYGAQFKGFRSLDAGGPLTLNAIEKGQVGIGLVFSSDGVVASKGLVVLDDDKKLQTADNVVPVVRADKASPELAAALGRVNQALTTDKLKELNKKVGVDKEDPADVADQFLKDNGLL